MSQTDAQLRAHVAKFADMPDAMFIRAAISTARYLDKQSRAVAIEALRRFDLLHPDANTPIANLCAGGVDLDKVHHACPKCGASDNDACKFADY